MAGIEKHTANMFCWADLATTDVEGAKKFYSQVLGWNAVDVPAGEGVFYTMFDKDGKQVCAAYSQDEQKRQQGIPPFWQCYVAVENVDAMTEKATQAGGEVVMPPFDVFDYGRMAVIKDTAGAVFALWQAKQHIGAQLWNSPGSICWNELYTNDLAQSEIFYNTLFGWTTRVVSGAVGEPYTLFNHGEQAAAGMLEIKKEWGEVPPCWSVYFAVDDLDRALGRVTSLGGKIDSEIMTAEGEGRFCVVSDPQGAYFLLMAMDH